MYSPEQVTINGMGAKGSFQATPTWQQEKWEYTCGVNGTGGAKPVRCATDLSVALSRGGQRLLLCLSVSLCLALSLPLP
eukprot:COSAG02_NODE_29261_length_573_cov_0.468354_2_plen_78_part_01